MAEKIDQEINAIRTILTTLESLEDDIRKNVVEYVLKRLNYFSDEKIRFHNQTDASLSNSSTKETTATSNRNEGAMHIKQFKESKLPKSSIEMAAIVAYYLQYLAEENKRKDRIGSSDLETWFRIADFPLPTGDIRFSLTNGAKSGYFDSAGSGQYKLNAVGYNLVKHNLPRTAGKSEQNRSKPSTKNAPKKNSKGVRKKK
jgi:hypothetical protein